MSAVDSFAGQVSHSVMIMLRVAGEGYVAEQLLNPESLARLEQADPHELAREAAAPLYAIAFKRD